MDIVPEHVTQAEEHRLFGGNSTGSTQPQAVLD